MALDYDAYLELLQNVSDTLTHLTRVSQEKSDAVRRDDLAGLDACMKQEQALSLTLRGYEQRRASAQACLGLEGVTLSALASHYPEERQLEAKAVSEELLRRYRLYQSASEVARSTLECNLHQIEQILASAGVEAASGTGYVPPSVAPPQGLRTNFRA